MKHFVLRTWNISFTKDDTMRSYTANDGLSALVGYLQTKTFGWVLVRTGHLIGPGPALKK